MNIKNTLKKTAGIAALVTVLSLNSCGPSAPYKRPNDSQYNPYVPIALEDIKYKDEGTRVIVQGDLKNVEDERLILESKLQISSILRNDFYTGPLGSNPSPNASSTSEVAWDSIAPMLRNSVKNPLDTTNIYNGYIKIFGIVNKDHMVEMRYIEINGKLYDAFK